MINFSTDSHLGQVLSTHTTHASRLALKEALYHQALAVTDINDNPHYCLGDLVHTYRNTEDVIQQAVSILGRLTNCIMGNHDVTNRVDSIGTLELLEPMFEVVPAVMEKCDVAVHDEGDVLISMVPHTNSQELFEKTLLDLLKNKNSKKSEILLLHCNYESPWENNETTLNLTEDVAKKLLDKYDYILIGHEHNHREELDGRVVLLGNIHPTNFGDISDKYRWTLDKGKLEKYLVWEKKKHYLKIDPSSELEISEDIQFLEVSGEVDSSEYPAYCKWLAGLWKRCPKAYAIRSNVEIITEDFTNTIDEKSLQNLTDTIKEELEEEKDLMELFEELLEEIE